MCQPIASALRNGLGGPGVVRVHHPGPDRGTDVETLPQVVQRRAAEFVQREPDWHVPGGMPDHVQPVLVERLPDRSDINLMRRRRRGLQGKVDEIEFVISDPRNLFERIAGRVIHRPQLHGRLR